MTIKFTNNATSTLASGINNSVTSMSVAAGQGGLFPTLSGADVFYATISNTSGSVEIVQVTARSTDAFTIVRAQDSTSALSWNTGDKVELRATAAGLGAMAQTANNLSDLASASTARTNLGLGTIATQAASNVSITGGSITGITDLAVADGGTGASTLASGGYLKGAGTSAITSQTGIPAGDITSGTVDTARLGSGTASSSTYLRGDSTWAAVAGYAGPRAQVFTSSGTFTVPAGITSVFVEVYGAGGGGSAGSYLYCNVGSAGGIGGRGLAAVTGLTPGASVTVTVGTGGAGGAARSTAGTCNGAAGGTTSFGAYASATGGGGATGGSGGSSIGAQGTFTTSGTLLQKNSLQRGGDNGFAGQASSNHPGGGGGGGLSSGGGAGTPAGAAGAAGAVYGPGNSGSAGSGLHGGAGGSPGGAGGTGLNTYGGGGGGGGGGGVIISW